MENPYNKLNIFKGTAEDEIITAHLHAIKRKTEEEKKMLNRAKEILIKEIDREKLNIHCLNFPSEEMLKDCIKQTIKPW